MDCQDNNFQVKNFSPAQLKQFFENLVMFLSGYGYTILFWKTPLKFVSLRCTPLKIVTIV